MRVASNGQLAKHMALNQEQFERFYETFGSKKIEGRYQPVHHRLATHWARVIELLYASERMLELALDPEYPYNLANLRIRVLNFLPLPIDVRKVAFQEGQMVKEGDLIARLADRDCQAELRKHPAGGLHDAERVAVA